MDKILFDHIACLIGKYSTTATVVDSESWYDYCIIRNGRLTMSPVRALLLRFIQTKGDTQNYVLKLVSETDIQRAVVALRKQSPEVRKRLMKYSLTGKDVERIIEVASYGLIKIKLDKYK